MVCLPLDLPVLKPDSALIGDEQDPVIRYRFLTIGRPDAHVVRFKADVRTAHARRRSLSSPTTFPSSAACHTVSIGADQTSPHHFHFHTPRASFLPFFFVRMINYHISALSIPLSQLVITFPRISFSTAAVIRKVSVIFLYSVFKSNDTTLKCDSSYLQVPAD